MLMAVVAMGSMVVSVAQADQLIDNKGKKHNGKLIKQMQLGVLFDVIDRKGDKKRRLFRWNEIKGWKLGDIVPIPKSAPPSGTGTKPTPKPTTTTKPKSKTPTTVAKRVPVTPRKVAKPRAGPPPTGSAASIFGPYAKQYCFSCHGPDKQEGKLRLDTLGYQPSNSKNYDQWQDVLAAIDLGEMPPKKAKVKPSQSESKVVTDWLTPTLKLARISRGGANGKTILRRLSRVQYRNTLRDLLNVSVAGKSDPTREFPPDGTTDGFSNVASSLIMSDLQMEMYIQTAEEVLKRTKYGSSRETKDFRTFATRAFRRPTSVGELAPYLRFMADDKSDPKRAYQAILCSPRFAYFSELPGKLDHYAVASRLSYFLWNSMPDKALLKLAEQEKLHDKDVLAEQVKRMLADSKSESFIDTFVWQWLKLQNMADMPAQKEKFPKYYADKLGPAMIQETKMFFKHVLVENKPITDFLDSDYTFVNGVLAKHYGIEGVSGGGFEKVSLKDKPMRGGLLGQAAILATTTDGMTTTPIYRGKWVMTVIFGKKLRSPPEDIPDLPDVKGAKTIRERLRNHRTLKQCAVCHVKIDPLGYAMEAFDPIGGYRTKYPNKLDIETYGKLSNGSYKDMIGFKKLLMKKQTDFASALTRKLLTHALGRRMVASDNNDVRRVTSATRNKGNGFMDLIIMIATDDQLFLRN
jgi:hypothetical protein